MGWHQLPFAVVGVLLMKDGKDLEMNSGKFLMPRATDVAVGL